MKFAFTSTELEWLRDTTTRVLMLIHDKSDRAIVRQATRLHRKFSPNATTVYMNQAERLLMFQLLGSRVEGLKNSPVANLEPALALMRKLARKETENAETDSRES
jgi:hypothetical protein